MSSWFHALIAVTAAAQLAVQLIPKKLPGRRSAEVIAGLCVLAVLLMPIRSCRNGSFDRQEWLGEILPEEAESLSPETEQWSIVAEAVFRLAEQNGVKTDGMRLSLITNEDGTLGEVQLFPGKCPYARREELRRMLEDELGVPVLILT